MFQLLRILNKVGCLQKWLGRSISYFLCGIDQINIASSSRAASSWSEVNVWIIVGEYDFLEAKSKTRFLWKPCFFESCTTNFALNFFGVNTNSMTFLSSSCVLCFKDFKFFSLRIVCQEKFVVFFSILFSQPNEINWGPKCFALIWTSSMRIYYYHKDKTLAGEEKRIYGLRSLRSHENFSLCFGPLQLLSKQKCHFLISSSIEARST